MAAKKTTFKQVHVRSPMDALRRKGEPVTVADDGTFVIFGTPQRKLVKVRKSSKAATPAVRIAPGQNNEKLGEQLSALVRRMKVV